MELRAEVRRRRRAEGEKDQLIAELEAALGEVKTLRGIIPICAYCKRVRRDDESWQQIESYVRQHTEAEFSHGICPECLERVFGEGGPPRGEQLASPSRTAT